VLFLISSDGCNHHPEHSRPDLTANRTGISIFVFRGGGAEAIVIEEKADVMALARAFLGNRTERRGLETATSRISKNIPDKARKMRPCTTKRP
jgi:hypothetical protein